MYKPHNQKIIAKGKLLQAISVFFTGLITFSLFFTSRYIIYHVVEGWEFHEAITKEIDLAEYILLSTTYPLYILINFFLVGKWLIQQFTSKELPFDLLLVELMLNGIIDTPNSFKKTLSRGMRLGWITKDIYEEIIESFSLLENPNPKSDADKVTIGYSIFLDRLYLVLLLIITGLIGFYLSFIVLIPSCLILISLLYRIDRYGKNSWLKVNLDGIFFGELNKFISWDYIARADLIKQKGDDWIIVNPFSLIFTFSDGNKYTSGITAYRGGWKRVYHVMKERSPVPIGLNILGKNGEE